MFKLILRLSRRQIFPKVCILILFIVIFYMIKIFYDDVPNVSNHIIFNLRALNHSIPNFIAEAHNIQVEDDPDRILLPKNEEKQNADYKEVSRIVDINEKSEIENQEQKITTLDIKYEAMIRLDEENIVQGLGENGEPVRVVPGVSPDLVKAVMKKEAFNKLLSDKIPFTRKVPDARHVLCTTVTYEEDLPSASVIIIFINEAWSTLLRTIHSTLLRSPEKHLKEIILVDDASSRLDLNGKLDYYLKTRLPDKVKLIRLKERNGLIRARLAGAEAATGDVLVFLDSHCECVVGWLEPLLQRIKDKNDAVVCPVIDVINDKDMAYMFNTDRGFQIGSFTWSGHFTWITIPEFEEQRRDSVIAPTRSPTMAGGLFAINKGYFWHLGSYDRGMEVWGGENLEMSFRIWQCGGSLEIVPCSRVGHIFRSFHPYSFPGRKDTHGINTARMAEVWMDDYKRLFYMHRPDLKLADIGDVTSRKLLRQELKCNDFAWFLKNVIPQKFIPDENVQAYGRIKTYIHNYCFDHLNQGEDDARGIGLYNCHNILYSSQFYSLSEKGELRREELCAEVEKRFFKVPGLIGGAKGNVTMHECNGDATQVWKYENHMIKNVATGYCIHSYGATVESYLTVADCRRNEVQFKWTWENIRAKDGSYILSKI